MRRSRLLVAESAVVGALFVMIALGGSLVTNAVPPSWSHQVDPQQVVRDPDLDALALYYNSTLTELGTGRFSNVSLLLSTFHSVDIPSSVNQTALVANLDLVSMNDSIPKAISLFNETRAAIDAKEYVNATSLVAEGCGSEAQARQSFSDLNGTQTSRLSVLSVPAEVYSQGAALTDGEISGLLAQCDLLRSELPLGSANLTISSPQTSVETGGQVAFQAALAQGSGAIGGQTVLFYLNGSYFASMPMDSEGVAEGLTEIPYVYQPLAVVQAVVAPNATIGFGGARSNLINLTVSFESTRIVLGDPPAYLPTHSFAVEGNLTTSGGAPLPGAPVRVTFVTETETTETDSAGTFHASFIVPANATDGIHYVYAAFASGGVFGPSNNFTSIDVVREPLVLSVTAPSLSFSGFSTQLSGRATANGTAVAGALVTVETPWGQSTGLTDASGGFRVSFQVPPYEFFFRTEVSLSARPLEPYVAYGSATAELGMLNPLLVVIPLLFVGLLTFEANQLRVFKKAATKEKAPVEVRADPAPEPLGAPDGEAAVPEMLASYRRALFLARKRLGLRLDESETVREMARDVKRAEGSEGSEAFSRLMGSVEDYLYSRDFDPGRVEAAKRDLAAMEDEWR